MLLKASGKISRKLKTSVSLLLLVCLAMPAASKDDLNFTSAINIPINTLDMNYCSSYNGPLPAKNTKSHSTYNMLSKFHISTKDLIARRRSDRKILKKVRKQLEITNNHIRSHRDQIAQIYADVKSVMKPDYHFEWLPSCSLDWYKTHVENLDKDTKMFILLTTLRDSLVNFAVTLDQMRHFGERKKYMSKYTEIKLIFDGLFNYLIAVLCEVETALEKGSSYHRKWRKLQRANAVILGDREWNDHPDHTAMLIQDWGVLTLYYKFLKDWVIILTSSTAATKRSGRPSSSLPRLPTTRHWCKPSGRGHGSPPGTIT